MQTKPKTRTPREGRVVITVTERVTVAEILESFTGMSPLAAAMLSIAEHWEEAPVRRAGVVEFDWQGVRHTLSRHDLQAEDLQAEEEGRPA